MKSFKVFLSVFVILLMTNCAKQELPSDTPDFIKTKIKQIKSEEKRNPPAKVYQYEYNGKVVYYFSAYCCDFPSELYDKKGNLLCHPDGGISGSGDGNCNDFIRKRTNEKLIWQDDRN